MTKKIFILLLLMPQIKLVEGQVSILNNFDSLVTNAISLSEEALYNGRLQEAKDILQSSYFNNFTEYSAEHELALTIQEIRIERFIKVLYQLETDPSKNFKRLNLLLPLAQKTEDKNIQANYFLTFSKAHRSIGNIDSALVYEERALKSFKELGKLEKVAEVRGSQISRVHNQFLREGKKEQILSLIPKYEDEIKFAALHSKYVLSYNTRHLAQVHRRQTFNYKEALRLFKISLSLREEIGFKPFIPASYSSIGDVYAKMEEDSSAIEMYLKSAELAIEIGFVRYQSSPYLSIGDIYLRQGIKEKAVEYYTKALKFASLNNYLAGIDTAIEKIIKINN